MSDPINQGSERSAARATPGAGASVRNLVLLRVVQARPRLFIAMACGIAIGLALPSEWRVTTRLLIGWNIATWLHFILAAIMIATASDVTIRKKAEIQDEGRFVILLLASLAALAAFGAIFAQLGTVKTLTGLLKDLHIALAAATIMSAWTFTHLMFGLHYAHDYFLERAGSGGRPAKKAGGLIFPGTKEPDYFDFLYFSFVIGVACATADVEITSQPMRRTALVHCVLAFFFNSAVLALTINIAAGLI